MITHYPLQVWSHKIHSIFKKITTKVLKVHAFHISLNGQTSKSNKGIRCDTYHEVVCNHLPGKLYRIFEFLCVNKMEQNSSFSNQRPGERMAELTNGKMATRNSPSKCIGTDTSSTVAPSVEKRSAASLTDVMIFMSAPGISNPSRRTPIRRLEMSPVSYI